MQYFHYSMQKIEQEDYNTAEDTALTKMCSKKRTVRGKERSTIASISSRSAKMDFHLVTKMSSYKSLSQN